MIGLPSTTFKGIQKQYTDVLDENKKISQT